MSGNSWVVVSLGAFSTEAYLAGVLEIHVVVQTVAQTFASVARLLVATEERRLRSDEPVIDTDDAAFAGCLGIAGIPVGNFCYQAFVRRARGPAQVKLAASTHRPTTRLLA
jgi:hypothetical protein